MQVLPITTISYGINGINFKGKAILDSASRELYERSSAFRDKVASLERSECGSFNIVSGSSRNFHDENISEIRMIDHYGESSHLGTRNDAYGTTDFYS